MIRWPAAIRSLDLIFIISTSIKLNIDQIIPPSLCEIFTKKLQKAFKMAFQPITSCAQEKNEFIQIESVLEEGTVGADIEEELTACPMCGIHSDWRTSYTVNFQNYFHIVSMLGVGALWGFLLFLDEAGRGRVQFLC